MFIVLIFNTVYDKIILSSFEGDTSMNILILLTELIATATYAVLGSMTAIKKRMDIFGTVILGITTATGGGIIRDIILGKTPPTAFVNLTGICR